MSAELRKDLVERYDYDDWRGANTLDEQLFIWAFSLAGNEFEGWRPRQIQPFREERPAFIRSIWESSGEESGAVLSVDVVECASRVEAHEYLLRILGEFQAPAIERLDVAFGDIAFGDPNRFSIVYARANLVLVFRNAGAIVTSPVDIAVRFDEALVRKPSLERRDPVPEIRQFEARARGIAVGSSAELEVEAIDPLDRPVWFKFYAASGAVFAEEGRLMYQPEEAGLQAVTVFAINPNRGAATARLELEVK